MHRLPKYLLAVLFKCSTLNVFFTLAVISVTEFYANANVFAAKNELRSGSLKYFKVDRSRKG